MQSIRAILVRSSAPYQATVSALVSTVRRFLACISSAITIRTYRITAKIHSRSEEHTSELQSLMRISYAVFCLKKKKKHVTNINTNQRLKHTKNITQQIEQKIPY